MDLAALAERVWYGRGAGAKVARLALAPAEFLFRGVVAARGALYDGGLLAAHALPLPALSVGNLTVGGTGKTPVAAWLARRLLDAGARPALVLRGVGDDEPRVHRLLNPDVPVVPTPDRVAGAHQARALGADVVVLDDAFQHRRARRTADLVLVSAERFAGPVRLLPAGPYREGLDALRRAAAVLVTRKSADAAMAGAVADALTRARPGLPVAVCHLSPDRLRRWDDPTIERPIAVLAGRRVLAVSGIGEPAAFEAQLAAVGASVVAGRFADHHAYDAGDAVTLARRAEAVDDVVTTLKDAVKLGPLWPHGARTVWYVSQGVEVERGAAALSGLLDTVLAARNG